MPKPTSCNTTYKLEQNKLIPTTYKIVCIHTRYDINNRATTHNHNIGTVYDMDNPNPLIDLRATIGVVGVVKIIEQIQNKKNETVPA